MMVCVILHRLHQFFRDELFFLSFYDLLLFIQGGPTTLAKADAPWSVRRESLSDKDRVLKTVKGE